MRSFCARTAYGQGVFVNGGIVRPNPHGLEECCAVARDVCCLQPNDADEVMRCSRLVVRDLQEERRENLPDSCEVVVGRLSDDRLKVLERISDFRHDLL